MLKDLTNLKIGEILVTKKIKHENRVMWECHCSCGQIFYERTSRLNGSEYRKIKCSICSSKLWTDEQIKYLIDNYSDTPYETLSTKLDKTINAIIGKATKLKLKRSTKFRRDGVTKTNKSKGRDLTIDNVKLISSKFYSLQEFRVSDCSAYNKAKEYNLSIICPHLLNMSGSLPQLILKEYVERLFKTKIIYNGRKTIKPLELDIYIPKYKIAFEYDGYYWHNNFNTNDKLKDKLCLENGIKLFRILEISKEPLIDIKQSLINLLDDINSVVDFKISIDDINNIKINVDFVKSKHFRIFEQYDSLYKFSKSHYYLYRKLKKFNLIEKFCSHMKNDLPKSMKNPFKF
jgi:hypothetical protein